MHWCYVEHGSADHVVKGRVPGTHCCDCESDSQLKIETAFNTCVYGKAWQIADEGKWLNIPTLLERFVGVSTPKCMLPESFSEMKSDAKIDDSIEVSLRKQIEADAENWSAKSKLFLLEFCKGLSRAASVIDACVLIESSRPLGGIMYDLLGNGKSRARATRMTLADPETLNVVAALEVLAAMLHDFGNGCEHWVLLSSVDVDFSDQALQDSAREQCLGHIAGLIDVFERRLSQPPYSWVVLAKPGSPEV